MCRCSCFKGVRPIHIGSPNIRLDPFQIQHYLPGVLGTSSGVMAAAKSVDHSASIELSTSWSWFAAALAA